MAKKVYLHVGLPKSGTTYLQAVLAENKHRLAERSDLLYPGSTWVAQVHAARDVLFANPHGARNPQTEGAWQRLVDEVSDWQGDAVISMEWLGSATPAQARRIVDSMPSAQVEVVVTVRDLGRTVPAAWQEFMQNWEQWSWTEFLNAVMSENPRATPAGNLFWGQQDIGRLLATWSDVVPATQLHVVTLPRPGGSAGELWNRFCEVLGIDGSQFDASGRGSNESLGLESAELMHRLNVVSRVRGVDWTLYDEMFKHALAKRGLSIRRHQESALRVPPEHEGWVRSCALEQARAIKASGAHLVGTLDDLEPVFAGDAAGPSEVTAEGILEAAVEGLVALAQDRGRDLTHLRERNAELHEQLDVLQDWHDISWTERRKRRLVQLSEEHAWVMVARQTYGAGRRLLSRVPGRQ